MSTIDRITTYVLGLGVALTVLAFVVSVPVGVGALVGATIAVADWVVIRWIAGRLLAASDRGKAAVSMLLVVKMALLLGLCTAVLWVAHVDALGFMIGMGALVLGVLAGSVHHTLAPAAPAAAPQGGD